MSEKKPQEQRLLDQVRIVMVRTSDTGNIGAAARAMKTMGLQDLVLVAPDKPLDGKAFARASGALDVLDQARTVASFEDAVADCQLVFGTSSRSRSIPWPHQELAQAANTVAQSAQQGKKIAIAFGREEHGLTNQELARCTYHMSIDANPEYPVMNVSAALQVVCYELRKQAMVCLDQGSRIEERWDNALAEQADLEGLYGHFEQVLISNGFMKADDPRQTMTRIRRLFNRSQLDKQELNLLRGILAMADKSPKMAK